MSLICLFAVPTFDKANTNVQCLNVHSGVSSNHNRISSHPHFCPDKLVVNNSTCDISRDK